MKRILLVLLCLLASPALADDTITSWTWSSVTGTFQAKLAALGWKNVPDQVTYTNTPVVTPVGGGTCTNPNTITWTKTGRVLTASGELGCNPFSGTVSSVNVPIPNGWTCLNDTAAWTDLYAIGYMCEFYSNGSGSSSVTWVLRGTNLGAANFPSTGGCFFSFQCTTTN